MIGSTFSQFQEEKCPTPKKVRYFWLFLGILITVPADVGKVLLVLPGILNQTLQLTQIVIGSQVIPISRWEELKILKVMM